MKVKGHREFTRSSALATVRRNFGMKIETVEGMEGRVIKTECYIINHDKVGNGTLGVLDYLREKHNIQSFVQIRKDKWVQV